MGQRNALIPPTHLFSSNCVRFTPKYGSNSEGSEPATLKECPDASVAWISVQRLLMPGVCSAVAGELMENAAKLKSK